MDHERDLQRCFEMKGMVTGLIMEHSNNVDVINALFNSKMKTLYQLKFNNSLQVPSTSFRLCEMLKTNQTLVEIDIMDETEQSVLVNHININTKWKQHGITIAGGHGQGNQLNQLNGPEGIYVDDDHQTIYIADSRNHRIVEWKYGAKNGQIVAGGNGKGDRSDQLSWPTGVIIILSILQILYNGRYCTDLIHR
ncbi:unnamed protein product [Adineta steineri]|uniref:NHL repeat containing protein n=2 Tax=Adineta steineri TaxID=433720 RepID=A0A813W6H2_9BILA|nr:unnamed protein product [Adineta steineri]